MQNAFARKRSAPPTSSSSDETRPKHFKFSDEYDEPVFDEEPDPLVVAALRFLVVDVPEAVAGGDTPEPMDVGIPETMASEYAPAEPMDVSESEALLSTDDPEPMDTNASEVMVDDIAENMAMSKLY